tara:strand:+ start:2470 stop:4617 length:2148 start_codon:yes stop_codon:yes gene_type:complete
MLDYEDHGKVLLAVGTVQDSESDMRERVRACQYFLETDDGQWEPSIIANMGNRPRYTDDRCNPIVDSIAGEMEQNEFAIRIKSTGSNGSEDTAETIEGLIRNIQNISGASLVYSAVSRSLVGSGLGGIEIVPDYIDADTMDQDLFIRVIEDFQNRVWFDDNAKMQDMSDAKWCIVIDEVTNSEYEDKFPEGKKQSIGQDRQSDVYIDKPDTIAIGRFLYKKPIDIELVRMTNGAVYKRDDKFESIKDELEEQGITIELDSGGEEKTRIRKSHKVCQRYMDGGGWLGESEETVFTMLPVIPCYGNFKIIDGKVVYRGAINKVMDQQRVHNMAYSREVEDVVLAPKNKYWGTPEQRKGHSASIETLNTNSDPWQDYTHVDGIPAPYMQGGSQINPALSALSMNSAESINQSAGVYAPQQGNNPNLQSGVALEKQIDKGDISTRKYFTSAEVMLRCAGKVIVGALPNTYDGARAQRILNEDGTSESVELNTEVYDNDTQKMVIINDLSIGEYDVTIEVGAAYASKQDQMVEAFTRIAAIDPTIMELARDVWFRNINQPGMDDVADRARAVAIRNGTIPQEQLTDEELQAMQQQQQNQQQQPDPMMVAAEAEMQKAQADMAQAQNKSQEMQNNVQLEVAKIELEREKIGLQRQQQELDVQKFLREKDDKFNVEAAKIDQGQQKIDLDTQKMINDMSIKLAELEQKMMAQSVKESTVITE